MLVGAKFTDWRCKVGTIALRVETGFFAKLFAAVRKFGKNPVSWIRVGASKPGLFAKLSIAAGKFGKNPVSGVGVRKSSAY